MALESPQVGYDAFSPFQVVLTSDTNEGSLVATVEVKFNADGYSPETVIGKFQELLDYLNAAPNFTLVQAQRNAFGYQPITPTGA